MANPKKWILEKHETKYLGFQVGHGVIKPLVVKIAAIQGFPPHKKCKQMQSFLGLENYYKCFVPHFADPPAPLSDALKRGNSKIL